MTSCKSRPLPSRGFTLLELMISIVLVAMIVIILVASMRAGYRSLEGGEKKAESMERFRVSMRLVDSQLQSCLPLTVKEEDLKRSVFIGARDSMTFASNRSLFSGRKGYVIASYRIESDEKGKQVLYLKENTIGMENEKETKLLDGFDTIRFEYLQAEKTRGLGGGGWSDELADTTDLPQMVKLHLEQGARKLSVTIPLRTRKPPRKDSEGQGAT